MRLVSDVQTTLPRQPVRQARTYTLTAKGLAAVGRCECCAGKLGPNDGKVCWRCVARVQEELQQTLAEMAQDEEAQNGEPLHDWEQTIRPA